MKRSIVFGLVASGLLFAACAENSRMDEDADIDLTAEETVAGEYRYDEMMYDPTVVRKDHIVLTETAPGDKEYPERTVGTSLSVFDQPNVAQADEMEEASLFVREAVSAAIVGTLMADLAIQHSDDPDVEALAISVKKDYALANRKLHKIAMQENWIVPVALTPEDQQKVYDLQHQAAVAYPDIYIERMLSEHNRHIASLNRYCTKNDDAVADWSEQQITTLRRHMVRGEELLNELASN